MGGGHTKPKGKQLAGHAYKRNLIPFAVPAKSKKRKTIRHKKSARY
jgi:hypothetical protein